MDTLRRRLVQVSDRIKRILIDCPPRCEHRRHHQHYRLFRHACRDAPVGPAAPAAACARASASSRPPHRTRSPALPPNRPVRFGMWIHPEDAPSPADHAVRHHPPNAAVPAARAVPAGRCPPAARTGHHPEPSPGRSTEPRHRSVHPRPARRGPSAPPARQSAQATGPCPQVSVSLHRLERLTVAAGTSRMHGARQPGDAFCSWILPLTALATTSIPSTAPSSPRASIVVTCASNEPESGRKTRIIRLPADRLMRLGRDIAVGEELGGIIRALGLVAHDLAGMQLDDALAHRVDDLPSLCVAITIVVPVRLMASSTSMMPSDVVGSRFPVGSSASRICGWFTYARAMATRCCSPPDSSCG